MQYAEASLALKKDNLMSLLQAAYAIPTPQFIRMHPGEEQKQLSLAETYAQEAYKVLDDLKKEANEPDADFARRKAGYASNLHADMGMIHLDRAQLGLAGMDRGELALAEEEYRLSVASADPPDPATYFRLGDACRLQGKVDDAIAAYSKASELGGPVKPYADQQINLLKRARSGAPAKP